MKKILNSLIFLFGFIIIWGITNTNLVAAENNVLVKETAFNETKYGVSFSGDNIDSFSYSVKYSDGTNSSINRINSEEEEFGIHTSTLPRNENKNSELYLFNPGITSVKIYSETNIASDEIIIRTYGFDYSDTNIKKAGLESDYSNYKKALFSKAGINLITREDWGASTESGWTPEISKPNKIIVHHTATTEDINNPSNSVRAIFEFHKYRCSDGSGSFNPSPGASNPANCDEASETWQDIGYNYIIDSKGNIYEGRAGGNGSIGAHSYPNSGTIGISIIGDYSTTNPSTASLESLEKLTAFLSDLNNIDLIMGSTMLGHKDRSNTICPGNVYNFLPNIVTKIKARPKSNVLIKNLAAKTLVDGQDLIVVNGKNQILLVKSNISAKTLNVLKNNYYGIDSFNELNKYIVIEVSAEILINKLTEISLIEDKSSPQPNYEYNIKGWDIDTELNRENPDTYSSIYQWNLDKIHLPEYWAKIGNCENNPKCGGDENIVVAVLDTGVAYEDYNFDAGSDYIEQPPEKILNFFFEIARDPTANGVIFNTTSNHFEGFERAYKKSPEFSHMDKNKFISPYDAAWDYLCNYRELNSDSEFHCNDLELEKINHANDDYGHGTAVASIIVGNPENNVGTAGIAYNVSVMPIKVFTPNDTSLCKDSNGGWDGTCSNPSSDFQSSANTLTLALGIDHAVENNADIINLSLGGSESDFIIEEAIQKAIDAEVIVISATGNESGDVAEYYPAALDGVVAVGASNDNDKVAFYSNTGEEVDIVAPVGDFNSANSLRVSVFQCTRDNDCIDETDPTLLQKFENVELYGTSFAAPQVSATAALVMSLNPDLTANEVTQILFDSATDIESEGKDTKTGYGLLNLEAMFELAYTPEITEVYRFKNNALGGSAHFYVVGLDNKNTVQENSKEGEIWDGVFTYETVAFLAYETKDNQCVVGEEVYRFLNNEYGSIHFYVIGEENKQTVIDNSKEGGLWEGAFTYETVAFCALTENDTDNTEIVPVYRFRNNNLSGSVHFYVTGEENKQTVIDNSAKGGVWDGVFTFENIAFYAFKYNDPFGGISF
ncbi:MAG: S8 family serine peptidase [Candidatus Dojkabacteria bacterium]|nr:S8 family serine peptidase [Candidatus Dojkabacteria bacterium]MDQ7020244.1 S8 family serine peptidase [Candidatus Dojkabacteria bacterium]